MVDDVTMAKAAGDTSAVDDDKDSSTLEVQIAAKQAAMLSGDVEPDEKGDSKPVLKPLDDGDEPVDTPVDDGEDDDTTILPAGHRRAALARGWTAEEIDHFIETKPEEAIVEFRKTFDKWQEESSKWSARGRVLMATEEKPADDKKTDDSSITEFDADALIEVHGNEELINALVGPLNKIVSQVNAATNRLSKSEQKVADSQTAALVIEAQTFLTSAAMRPYEKVYGGEPKDLTTHQFENRMQLFEEADIIVAGAKAHGIDISVGEALARAHASISQDTRDEGIRAEIRKSMKKRTKTSRGSGQRSAPADKKDGPISEDELVKRTEVRLKTLKAK